MPPSNISAATATDIAALPYNNVQNVFDAGITYTVWYKITPNFTGLLEVFGFGSLAGYKPTTFIWTGTGTTSWPNAAGQVISQNKPVQFPVITGQTFYLEFRKNGNFDPSSLTVDVQRLTEVVAPGGSILVNDDTNGYGAAILSAITDYTVLRYKYPFPAGEAGDVLATSGRFLFSDEFVGLNLELYENDLSFIMDVAFSWIGAPRIRACQGASKFYVGSVGNGLNTSKVRTVDNNGVLGPIIDLGVDGGISGLTALAAKNDETILYYSGRGSSLNSQIKRLDLVTLLPLSDLAADIGGTYQVVDILYLANDTILVGYWQSSPSNITVKAYDTTGAILNTINLGGGWNSTKPRLTYAIDDPNSFWIFLHPSGTGASKLRNIKVSDGSTLAERNTIDFEVGAYQAAETATPTARAGSSFSCPIAIIRASTGAPSTGIIIINKVTNPSGHSQVFQFNAGGGLSPSAFQLSDGQMQQYNNVPVGTYSIEEIVPAGWSVSYNVSDGSPINALSLQAGETIVITVTNTLPPNVTSGIYKIVPEKRQDTLWLENFTGTRDVKIP